MHHAGFTTQLIVIWRMPGEEEIRRSAHFYISVVPGIGKSEIGSCFNDGFARLFGPRKVEIFRPHAYIRRRRYPVPNPIKPLVGGFK